MGGSKPSKFENNETYQNVKDLGLERKSVCFTNSNFTLLILQ